MSDGLVLLRQGCWGSDCFFFFFKWEFWGLTAYFCTNRDFGVRWLGFAQMGNLGSGCLCFFQIGIWGSDNLVMHKQGSECPINCFFSNGDFWDPTARFFSNRDFGV